MKKLLIFCLFIIVYHQANAQETKAELEYNIKSVQIGYLNFSLNDETRLTRKLSLKTSVTFEPYNYRSESFSKGYIVYPYLNLETRWYSNLDRRAEKYKKTEGNTGNIWSIIATYSPDWIVLTSQESPIKNSLIRIGPNYTIRRTLGKHFDFEGSAHSEYGYIFQPSKDYSNIPYRGSYFYGGIGVKIGYHFIKK